MKPDDIATLARRIDPLAVMSSKGVRIRTYSPASPHVRISYDPRREGFVSLTVGDKTALVHKDELIYVTRFAKGHSAV